jgi:succinate dehydrogenase / fumarate reductase iron-sulfur subunit
MRTPTAEIVPVVPPVRGQLADIESHISEFAADVAGSLSPFGDDIEFPLPVERLGYRHPGPANRPALAGD